MSLKDLVPFRRHRGSPASLPVRHATDNPFVELQAELNRWFDGLLPSVYHGRGDPSGFPGGGWDFVPEVAVKESDKEVEVTAELPGVDSKDLDVCLDRNLLTIRGEKRAEKTAEDGWWTCCERSYGSFVRTIPVDAEVDSTRVDATFKDGVLKVTLPKLATEDRGKGRIKVRAG